MDIIETCLIIYDFSNLTIATLDTGTGYQGEYESVDDTGDSQGPMRCEFQHSSAPVYLVHYYYRPILYVSVIHLLED